TFLPINWALFDKPQELGSVLTYYQRYMKGALLGVATEEDDDAKGAESGKNAVVGESAQPAQAAAQPPVEEKYSGKESQKAELHRLMQSEGILDANTQRE